MASYRLPPIAQKIGNSYFFDSFYPNKLLWMLDGWAHVGTFTWSCNAFQQLASTIVIGDMLFDRIVSPPL